MYIVPRRKTRSTAPIRTTSATTSEQFREVATAAQRQAYHEFRRDNRPVVVSPIPEETHSDSEVEIILNPRLYPQLPQVTVTGSCGDLTTALVTNVVPVVPETVSSDRTETAITTPSRGTFTLYSDSETTVKTVPDSTQPDLGTKDSCARSPEFSPSPIPAPRPRLIPEQPRTSTPARDSGDTAAPEGAAAAQSLPTSSDIALAERVILDVELSPDDSSDFYDAQLPDSETEVRAELNVLITRVQHAIAAKVALPSEITNEQLLKLYHAYQTGRLRLPEVELYEYKKLYDSIVVTSIESPELSLEETVIKVRDNYAQECNTFWREQTVVENSDEEQCENNPQSAEESETDDDFQDTVETRERDVQTQVSFSEFPEPAYEIFPEEDPLSHDAQLPQVYSDVLTLVGDIRDEIADATHSFQESTNKLANAFTKARIQQTTGEDIALEELRFLFQDVHEKYDDLLRTVQTSETAYTNPVLNDILRNLNPANTYPQEAVVNVLLRPRQGGRVVPGAAQAQAPAPPPPAGGPVQANPPNPARGGGQGPQPQGGAQGGPRPPQAQRVQPPRGGQQGRAPRAAAAAPVRQPVPVAQPGAQQGAQAQAPRMAQGQLIGVLQGLQQVLQNQNQPRPSESITLLPKDTFSGIDPAKAKTHFNAFKRYVEYHKARRALQTWADIQRMFAVTLAPPASDWFASLPIVGANAVNTMDTLEVAFLKKYNVWGTSERQWEEAWDALKYNAAKDDYALSIADVKSLGSLLHKTDDQQRNKCVRILPPFIQAQARGAQTIDELATIVNEMLPIYHQHVKDNTRLDYSQVGQVLTHSAAPQPQVIAAAPNLVPQQQIQPQKAPGVVPMQVAGTPQQTASVYYTVAEPDAAQGTLEEPVVTPMQIFVHNPSPNQQVKAQPGEKVQYVAPNGKQIGTYEVPAEGVQGKTFYQKGRGRGRGRGGGPQNQGQRNPNQQQGQAQQKGFKPTSLNMCKLCVIGKHQPGECPETKANLAYLLALTGQQLPQQGQSTTESFQ